MEQLIFWRLSQHSRRQQKSPKSATYNSVALDNQQPLKISVLIYEMTIILLPAVVELNS